MIGKLEEKKQNINGTKKMNKRQTSKKCVTPPGPREFGLYGFHLLSYCRSYGTGKTGKA
jgi:hypothetical protein